MKSYNETLEKFYNINFVESFVVKPKTRWSNKTDVINTTKNKYPDFTGKNVDDALKFLKTKDFDFKSEIEIDVNFKSSLTNAGVNIEVLKGVSEVNKKSITDKVRSLLGETNADRTVRKDKAETKKINRENEKNLKENLKDTNSEIKVKESSIAKQEATITKNELDLGKKEAELNNIKSSVGENTLIYNNKKNEVDELKKKIDEQKTELQKTKDDLKDLEAKKKSTEEQLEAQKNKGSEKKKGDDSDDADAKKKGDDSDAKNKKSDPNDPDDIKKKTYNERIKKWFKKSLKRKKVKKLSKFIFFGLILTYVIVSYISDLEDKAGKCSIRTVYKDQFGLPLKKYDDDGKIVKDDKGNPVIVASKPEFKTKKQGEGGCLGMKIVEGGDDICPEDNLNCQNEACSCCCKTKENCPNKHTCSVLESATSCKQCLLSCKNDEDCINEPGTICSPIDNTCTKFCGSDKDCGDKKRCVTQYPVCMPHNVDTSPKKNTVMEELKIVKNIIKDESSVLHQSYNYFVALIKFYKKNTILSQDFVTKDENNDYSINEKFNLNVGRNFFDQEDIDDGMPEIFTDIFVNIIGSLNGQSLSSYNDILDENSEEKLAFLLVYSRNQLAELNKNLDPTEREEINKMLKQEGLEQFTNLVTQFSNKPVIGSDKCYRNVKVCEAGEKCKVCPFSLIPVIGKEVCLPCFLEESSALVNALIYVGIIIVVLILIVLLVSNLR